jgi:hypothetical protein
LHTGFDYSFNAVHDETNELFVAYKDMFEVAISQGRPYRTLLLVYFPFISNLFVSATACFVGPAFENSQPDETVRTLRRGREVIHRVAGRLIQEKKQKIAEGEKSGDPYEGKDLLTLMRMLHISAHHITQCNNSW